MGSRDGEVRREEGASAKSPLMGTKTEGVLLLERIADSIGRQEILLAQVVSRLDEILKCVTRPVHEAAGVGVNGSLNRSARPAPAQGSQEGLDLAARVEACVAFRVAEEGRAGRPIGNGFIPFLRKVLHEHPEQLHDLELRISAPRPEPEPLPSPGHISLERRAEHRAGRESMRRIQIARRFSEEHSEGPGLLSRARDLAEAQVEKSAPFRDRLLVGAISERLVWILEREHPEVFAEGVTA